MTKKYLFFNQLLQYKIYHSYLIIAKYLFFYQSNIINIWQILDNMINIELWNIRKN